jgi:hypothetical protein
LIYHVAVKDLLLSTTAIVLVSAGLAAAQTAAGSAPCGPRERPRTRGSLSAKGSTPIGAGYNLALTSRQDTKGSNSAKASTPIAFTAPAQDRPRSRGTTTAKGSVALPAGVGCAADATR